MNKLVLALLLCSAWLFPQDVKRLPNNTGTSQYVVFAWNDLGMHCLNPTYDQAVILPPYNNVLAQVVKRGNPPEIVTSGVTVSYSIFNNTTSADKGNFGQFWQNSARLFGVAPALNKGLNLVDPTISNGLSGDMIVKGTHFQVNGIPVTPIDDQGVWNPYQTGVITVKDGNGTVVASTKMIVPTSDEINCSKCHGATNPFRDVMLKHDIKYATNLLNSAPVLCASCHGSPALAQVGPGSAKKYLSQSIHGSHARFNAACYDCHPGATTRCSRSEAHTNPTGGCLRCHGSMANVSATITLKGRVPWLNEPKCVRCHSNVPGVDTHAELYRNSTGHGGMYCVACHNSPHAMLPSSQAVDGFTAVQYQGKAKTIGSCSACHNSNKGEGFGEWFEQHGSNNAEAESACNVCHTGFLHPIQANFPHGFLMNTRTATVGSGPVKNVPVVETPLPPPATGKIAIVTLPQSQTVTVGQKVTFTIVVTGNAPITYKWYKNGAAVTGQTKASYSFTAQASDNGATFFVAMRNPVGSAFSRTVNLTVQ
jgi:hypothetical protein